MSVFPQITPLKEQICDYRILQIIAPPFPIFAKFKEKNGEIIKSPIICLALIEEDGNTDIRFMDSDGQGWVQEPNDVGNFDGFEFKHELWVKAK